MNEEKYVEAATTIMKKIRGILRDDVQVLPLSEKEKTLFCDEVLKNLVLNWINNQSLDEHKAIAFAINMNVFIAELSSSSAKYLNNKYEEQEACSTK